jgi:hypothetical protein
MVVVEMIAGAARGMSISTGGALIVCAPEPGAFS